MNSKDKRWRKGEEVEVLLSGAGVVTRERKAVLRADKRGVWLDNGAGNDPSGPFDPASGRYLGGTLPGFSQRMVAATKEQVMSKGERVNLLD